MDRASTKIMRPLWSGSIGFGLVNIPVKLYSATQESTLDLDMLDKKDHARIRFKRVNENTGREVDWDNIVRAFDVDGRYVVLADTDIQRASAKKSEVIEIERFVNEEEIDGIYFETPYYLAPDKSGIKAYGLLREALIKSGRAGVGTFVMRNKEHLALLRARGEMLMLMRLRFHEEIRRSRRAGPAGKGSRSVQGIEARPRTDRPAVDTLRHPQIQGYLHGQPPEDDPGAGAGSESAGAADAGGAPPRQGHHGAIAGQPGQAQAGAEHGSPQSIVIHGPGHLQEEARLPPDQ